MKLRPHQVDALNAIKAAITAGNGMAKGRIVIPTGGGKTFIEAATIDYQANYNSVSRVHLILAPRIILLNQLMGEFAKYNGPIYRKMAFHSGKSEPDYALESGIKWKEHATTNLKEIEKAYANSKTSNQDLLIFCTYHSAVKLLGLKFDTVIADESQYCVQEGFNDTIVKLDARVQLFFTATEKYTPSNYGRGLNNNIVYGDRLYEIKPQKLIELGLIVPPKLHIMYATTSNRDNSIVHEVIEIAKEQIKHTTPYLGFNKTLYALRGTNDIKIIEHSISRLKEEFPEFEFFTISSKNGARIDNVKVSRENEFLPRLFDAKNALIFHFDILSEGIDVDGISGVALLRNMCLSKLQQTVGRSLRVYKLNPTAKKYALVSVSVINGNQDDKDNVKKYVKALMLSGYDISAENVIETGRPRHEKQNIDIDDAYEDIKSKFLEFNITDVIHEVENELFLAAMNSFKSIDDKLNFIMDSE